MQGDTILFSLYFAAIPENIKTIDIVERIKKRETWSFFGVQMKPNLLVSNYYTMFEDKKDFTNYYLYNRTDLDPVEGFWKLQMYMNVTLVDGERHKIKMLKEEDIIAIVKENDTYLCYTLDGYLMNFGIIELPLEKESYKMVFWVEGQRYITKKFKLEKKFEKEWSLPDFYKMAVLGTNYDKKSQVIINSKAT